MISLEALTPFLADTVTVAFALLAAPESLLVPVKPTLVVPGVTVSQSAVVVAET